MSGTRELAPLIWQDDDRVSGAVCFYGTRVPVQTIAILLVYTAIARLLPGAAGIA